MDKELIETISKNLDDLRVRIENMILITDTPEWKEFVAAFALLDTKLKEMEARDEGTEIKVQNPEEPADEPLDDVERFEENKIE